MDANDRSKFGQASNVKAAPDIPQKLRDEPTNPRTASSGYQTRSSMKPAAENPLQPGHSAFQDSGKQASGASNTDKKDQSTMETYRQKIAQQTDESLGAINPLKASAAIIGGLAIIHWALGKFPDHVPQIFRLPTMSDMPSIPEMPDMSKELRNLQDKLKALPADLPDTYLESLPQSFRRWIVENGKQKQDLPVAWKDLPESYMKNLPRELKAMAREYEHLMPEVNHSQLAQLRHTVSHFLVGVAKTAAVGVALVMLAGATWALYNYLDQRGFFKSGTIPGRVKEQISPYVNSVSRPFRDRVIDPLQEAWNDTKNAKPVDNQRGVGHNEGQDGQNSDDFVKLDDLPKAGNHEPVPGTLKFDDRKVR